MKRHLLMYCLAFFSIATSSCGQGKPASVIDSSGVEIKVNLIGAKAFNAGMQNQLLIDVRTPQEFKYGHIENAININFYSKNWLDNFEGFDKSEPVYVYCKSGNRSSYVSRKLIQTGFTQVFELKNGVTKWKKNGFQLVRN
ncbi:MAG: hypothetical protein COB60_08785 [Flavobacteriaceae bacterium]|nr:MAG: hypothetical protein COB60_08785 [Flavobacteriaceae bacterium]